MVKGRQLHPKPIFDEPSLIAFLRNHGVKPVHATKIWRHVLANPECSFDEIPGIPDRIRAPLAEEFVYMTSTLVKSQVSAIDGTIKMLVRLQDGGEVEAVLIRHTGEAEDPEKRQADRCGQRDTLCLSSQVGCRLGCTFCATGTMGLQGNLWAGEIQEQLLHARTLRTVSNLVFMGMGEPLENYEGVVSAIRCLSDVQTFGIAPSSITVSTVGIVGNMRRLMDDLPKIKMAFSLHAPNQELREQIVPIAKSFKLPAVMDVIDEYAERGGKKCSIMVSYCMLEGVNDGEEHARELCELLGKRPVIVNLIPYNSFEGNVHDYRTPSPERVDAFLRVLEQADVRVFERRHHGRDIGAACGQLAKQGGSEVADIETGAGLAPGPACSAPPGGRKPPAPVSQDAGPAEGDAGMGRAAAAAFALVCALAVATVSLRLRSRGRP